MAIFHSSMSIWMLITLLITVLIFSISCFFVKKEPTRDMKSKFESGIDQNEQEFPLFYLHFFYVGILFLIFDVEIILSIPMIQSSMTNKVWVVFWTFFILVIFLGLILETMIDSIEWKE